MTSRTLRFVQEKKFWTLSSLHFSAYQPPLKRKATSTNKQKTSKQWVKKTVPNVTVPNVTEVVCEMVSDADCDAILAESGMEPGVPSTSGTMSESIDGQAQKKENGRSQSWHLS